MAGGPRGLKTSCTLKATDGLVVETDNERVRKSRRMTLELLLARCPNVPIIQTLARAHGVSSSRFSLDNEDCILCGQCVRVCKERMGVAAIGIFNRGAKKYVATPYQQLSEVCRSCGACASVCPTGCIDFTTFSEKTPVPLLSEWNVGTRRRKAISIAFEQAVPKTPVIDKNACVHLNTGACGICADSCVAKAINFDQQDEIESVKVGAIILATGFDPMDPTPLKEYGYGVYPNVFTNLEFERLSNATGPTGGKLLMRDADDRLKFTRPPESVAILHCIGSRDLNYHEYCSRTCCMYALKYAHLLKDKVGHQVQVYNFYIDMRCFGKGYEEFYRRIQSEGVRMIRGKAVRVTDRAQSEEEQGKLVVIAEDTLSQSLLRVPVEMVVLCTAMEPRKDAVDIARTFGISIGSDGFFLEEHPKLEPVSTATAGVFLAGACQGPKDIPDAVAQSKAAASMAQALISLGEVEVHPMVSHIDPDICIGCRVCIGLCAYGAIEFDTRRGISVVNDAVCKGCGSCAGYCPSGAAKIGHFTDKQIFAEVEGLLATGS
ncbi:MAG: 4Fe-4S dicluster domain-containing protein [Deltaproteobacteria bacterium]|nr:4Fe-4S dicluster domain-containing protein [Deltaproteobacteria bacterium]